MHPITTEDFRVMAAFGWAVTGSIFIWVAIIIFIFAHQAKIGEDLRMVIARIEALEAMHE